MSRAAGEFCTAAARMPSGVIRRTRDCDAEVPALNRPRGSAQYFCVHVATRASRFARPTMLSPWCGCLSASLYYPALLMAGPGVNRGFTSEPKLTGGTLPPPATSRERVLTVRMTP